MAGPSGAGPAGRGGGRRQGGGEATTPGFGSMIPCVLRKQTTDGYLSADSFRPCIFYTICRSPCVNQSEG